MRKLIQPEIRQINYTYLDQNRCATCRRAVAHTPGFYNVIQHRAITSEQLDHQMQDILKISKLPKDLSKDGQH